MNIRWIVLAVLLAPAARAGNPADITLTLASRDGRTQFRQGEAIELQLKFQSSVPGKYAVWMKSTYRTARNAEYDRFTAEPAAGAVDPLADCPGGSTPELVIGRPPVPTPVNGAEVVVNLFLNEWVSFRQPGRYRVTADTTRLVTAAQPETRLPMRSSALEITILPADPEWADAQLKQAAAVLENPGSPSPGVVQRQAGSYEQQQAEREATERAARTVRFLETPAAARALVRYLGRGPQYAQPQLRAGIDSTPYRKEAIAALEEAVAAPDVPIYQEYYFALERFAELARLGPLATMSSTGGEETARWMQEVSMPYRERAKPIDAEVTARMAAALANKRGEALATSLAVLAGAGPQVPPAPVREALLANLALLPENTGYHWLTWGWPSIASPAAEPILKTWASGDSVLRDMALVRLNELDPAAVRPIALDRIRRADLYRDAYHNDRALLLLPDKTLPELDEALADNFERNMYRADLLLARYASPAAAGRVKAFVEKSALCSGPIMAYLFRVDADYAAGRLARMGARCSLLEIQGSEDLPMTPALEKQLIRDLDPAGANGVRELLQNGGSAAAKEALLDAMVRARDNPSPAGVSSDYLWASAILTGAGWLPTSGDFDRVLAACQTDFCRHSVGTLRSHMAEPLGIVPDSSPVPSSFASVGPFHLRTMQQMKDKLAQFPKGASFYLAVGYPESWWGREHTRELREMLEAAGMKVVEAPERPPASR
jgi:hypothetical protein